MLKKIISITMAITLFFLMFSSLSVIASAARTTTIYYDNYYTQFEKVYVTGRGKLGTESVYAEMHEIGDSILAYTLVGNYELVSYEFVGGTVDERYLDVCYGWDMPDDGTLFVLNDTYEKYGIESGNNFYKYDTYEREIVQNEIENTPKKFDLTKNFEPSNIKLLEIDGTTIVGSQKSHKDGWRFEEGYLYLGEYSDFSGTISAEGNLSVVILGNKVSPKSINISGNLNIENKFGRLEINNLNSKDCVLSTSSYAVTYLEEDIRTDLLEINAEKYGKTIIETSAGPVCITSDCVINNASEINFAFYGGACRTGIFASESMVINGGNPIARDLRSNSPLLCDEEIQYNGNTVVETTHYIHMPSDWVCIRKQDSNLDGLYVKRCIICGRVTDTKREHQHTEVIDSAVLATCTKTGLTAGKKCSVCGTITVAQQTAAKKAHTEVTIPAVASTCTKTGLATGKKCSVCGTITVAQKTIAKKPHTYKDVLVKATLSKNGSITPTCSVCGSKGSATAIAYPKTIKLSSTSIAYDGKAKTPTVTVTDSTGNALKKDTDYTVKYASGRKNIGEYKVTITFKGNYSGTKTLSFQIVPKGTEISSVSAASQAFTANWKKQATQTTGYQLQYSTNSDLSSAKTVTIKKNTTVSQSVSKLKGNAKYYVRVRTYKTVDGTNYYSAWSAKKSVTTKPAVGITLNTSSETLYVGGTKTLSYSTYLSKVTVTWKSSDTSVAKVSSSGKVTAVKKGTATITASFKNGGKTYKATCKITVKSPSVKLNKSNVSLEKGEALTLKATTLPSNSSVSWSSSNSKVAKVSSSGKVTGIKNGSATITVTMKYGGKTYTASCKVKVASLLDELADGFSAQLIVPTNGGMNSYCQVKYTNHTGKKIVLDDGLVYANGKGCSNSKFFDNEETIDDGYYMVVPYYRDVLNYFTTKDMYLDSSSEAHTSIIVNGKRVYISFDTEGNTIFGYKWSDIGVY